MGITGGPERTKDQIRPVEDEAAASPASASSPLSHACAGKPGRVPSEDQKLWKNP